MTNVLDFRSGFLVTDATGHEVVTVLPCRLRFRGGAYGEVQTLFRSVALDQRTIHVEEFTGGAEEVRAAIRYHGDADALRALLREGSRGRTLTYYPDLAVPGEAYPVQLMSHGPVVEIAPDSARFAYGEWEAAVTLRRIDGGSLAPLVSGNLVQVGPAGPMTGATFTRATAGTRISAARRIESIVSGLRRVTWIEVNGVLRPFTLLEAARTQVAANPQAPASWTSGGTAPNITTGITDPWGGAAAILFEDTDPGTRGSKSTACTFTGDGTKLAIIAVRAGSLASILVRLWDDTASAIRHEFRVTWQGGTTAPTLATVSGAGTLFTPVPVYDTDGALWWLIPFSATGVVAANTNIVQAIVDPDTATGTFYLAGGNAWDATYPSSWQGPTLGTRNADEWSVPYLHGPMAATYAMRFVEQAASPWAAAGGSSPRFWQIGAGAGADLIVYRVEGASTYAGQHATVAGGSSSTLALAPAVGDLIELMLELFADGSVQLHGRKNGGTLVSGAAGDPTPLDSEWAADTLHIGSVGAVAGGDIAFGGLVGRRGTGHAFDALMARIPGAA